MFDGLIVLMSRCWFFRSSSSNLPIEAGLSLSSFVLISTDTERWPKRSSVSINSGRNVANRLNKFDSQRSKYKLALAEPTDYGALELQKSRSEPISLAACLDDGNGIFTVRTGGSNKPIKYSDRPSISNRTAVPQPE